MINTPEQAIKHFHFKISKHWKATETDAQAFKVLKNFVVKKQNEQVQDHELFAKLYVFAYGEFLKRYKSTVFDILPQKELNKFVLRPFTDFLQDFTDLLNVSDQYKIISDLNILKTHPALIKNSDAETDILEKALKNDETNDAFMGNVWKVEDVESNLISMINGIINAQ
jgi:hypothetical protein